MFVFVSSFNSYNISNAYEISCTLNTYRDICCITDCCTRYSRFRRTQWHCHRWHLSYTWMWSWRYYD